MAVARSGQLRVAEAARGAWWPACAIAPRLRRRQRRGRSGALGHRHHTAHGRSGRDDHGDLCRGLHAPEGAQPLQHPRGRHQRAGAARAGQCIARSLPTLMGFTAALGTGLVGSPWALPAAWIFGTTMNIEVTWPARMQTLWQMPHFYALAWRGCSIFVSKRCCVGRKVTSG